MSVDAGPQPAEAIIGLDVGTSRVKAVAYRLDVHHQVSAFRDQRMLTPVPGWQVQDPAAILAAATGALAECVAQLDGVAVIGISVTSALHGLLALDREEQPLTALVTWADSRSRDEARWLRTAPEGEALYRATGAPIHPMTPLVKLRWFARHEPDLFHATRWWVGLKDWLLHGLTGRLVTELSSASGSGLLEMATRTWHPPALWAAGIRVDQLPPILPTTATLPLDAGVAASIGLPAGTPVVVGAGDGPVANLGSGASSPGVAGLSIGTSGAVRMLVPEPRLDDAGTLFCYALTESAWAVGGAISNGGSVVDWAARALAPDLAGGDGGVGVAGDELLALAATAPPGSGGLVMLPYVLAERAPLWDADLPGTYLGLRPHHTRAHLARAAVEGVGLQLRILLDQLHALEPVRRVQATGGAFLAPLWREVIGSVLDRPTRLVDGIEGTALGAAALGLFALDRAPSLEAAVGRLCDLDAASRDLAVDPHLVETYRSVRASVPGLVGQLDTVARLFASPAPAGTDESEGRGGPST